MNDSLFFATFDPFTSMLQTRAASASRNPPAFSYEYCVEQHDGKRYYIKGFCCTACATGLLQKLAGREAREWAQEEAELEADNMDITDPQKRRLFTFGNVAAH